jgi:hypothetical protein
VSPSEEQDIVRATLLLALAFIVLLFGIVVFLFEGLLGRELGDADVAAAAIAAGLVGVWIVANSVHRVNEGELVVIRRVGRYGGARGPGLVWVTPVLEEIARYLPVSMQAKPFVVEPVFARDCLPLRLHLTMWYRLEPRLAGRDESQFALFFGEEQWDRTIRGELDGVARRVVGRYAGLELLNDIACRDRTEAETALELRDRLRDRGVVLDQERGIVLGGIDVEQRLKDTLIDMTRVGIDAETQKRFMDKIRKDYPDLSPDIVGQLIASITRMDFQQVAVRMPSLIEAGVGGTRPPETGPKPSESAPVARREAWRRAIREVKDIDFETKPGA